MEDLINAMAEFTAGPNCNTDYCSNFHDCPAIRLGEKLRKIATSEEEGVAIALRWGIRGWSDIEHVQRRVGQLNVAVTACLNWDLTGKRSFEASSMCASKASLGKALVFVDVATATGATQAGLTPATVYLNGSRDTVLEEPQGEHEEAEILRVSR